MYTYIFNKIAILEGMSKCLHMYTGTFVFLLHLSLFICIPVSTSIFIESSANVYIYIYGGFLK